METYRSNGKLLLTGEYVVLDGAVSLAVPTQYGQSLVIKPIEAQHLYWKSFDNTGTLWFEGAFSFKNFEIINQHQNESIAQRLKDILRAARILNPDFLNTPNGYEVETQLDFPKNWGLGTSSTLINNVAKWANVNAFKLLELTFGGSGYDIACAQHNTAITYQIFNKEPRINPVAFNPIFKKHLYFVYLNKKQNSRDGIAHYKALEQDLKPIISKINTITEQMLVCSDVNTFETLIETHEQLISKAIQQPTVKSLYFNDFKGAIKSLGAWGGDFILAASKTNPSLYFKNKGFNTVIAYNDMILK
ncbi:GYDIA family GHMP kinase [Jejuia pallidilutea]|uniref:Mevalonate kinase n=1 Tax=Jejuia pallidilutea TaxID=504487 RepID=A0A090WA59_9FLAO|nr:GYDIA family GHMP kinase [Jejuia pallidilutea]GAL73063.1 hypothetical protein JCM19302_242 [Jejuia pallidilutea]GAL90288.1 hypothetical protein JCM19538_53 [Jejuia pallidilutea]